MSILFFPSSAFSFKIGLEFRIMPYCGEGTHVQMFFHGLVGHMVDPGPFLYGRTGSMLERYHTAITGQLLGVLVPCKEIGENNEI